MAKEEQQRVFLIPELMLKIKSENNTIVVIKLKHPRTGTPSLYAIDSNGKQIYEIVQFTDDFSSWFINESVEKDGTLYIMTPADPLFLILPYLNQGGKYCPLQDMLVDDNYPDIKCLLPCCTPQKLEAVTDSKVLIDETVYRFNKKKALSWLQNKVERTSAVLQAKNVSVTDGSKADNLVLKGNKEMQTLKEEYCNHACHLVAEYLPEDFSKELFFAFGLKSFEAEKRRAEVGGINAQPHKKRKTEEIVNPLEDYSKEISMDVFQPKQKSKLTSAQKQLLKVDKSGMKQISSFFKKK